MRPTLRIQRLRPGAAMPRYMSDGAAGLDLAACLGEPMVLAPGARAVVPTGLKMAIPDGYEGQVRPRSGLAARHGVTCLNSPGTLDSDYRGEVCVILVNHGQEPFRVEHGMRIAQLVVTPVARVEVEETDLLDATTRGEGGFGSTGH